MKRAPTAGTGAEALGQEVHLPISKRSTPPRGLTVAFIEALQPDPQRRYEVPNRRAPGLVLRVLPSGKRIFRWYVTNLGRVVTIGPYHPAEDPPRAFVSLKMARGWLDRLKAAYAGGTLDTVEAELKDYLGPSKDPAPATLDMSVLTVAKVADEFYARRLLPHRKLPNEARATLDKDILSKIGGRPIAAVRTPECAHLVENVVDRGSAGRAGKVLGLVKQLFRFAESRGYIDRNPASPLHPIDLGVITGSRQRWLTEEEIPMFWAALERDRTEAFADKIGKVQRHPAMSPAARAGLKVLLLTAVRTGELLKARWENVDLKAATWTVPVVDQKGTLAQAQRAKPWVVPLAPAALVLFKELKALAGESPWVMSSEAEDGHYTDKSLGRAMRRLFQNKPPLLTLPGGPASPHDLRRTARTHLGKLRVPLHVVERCLNHSLGRDRPDLRCGRLPQRATRSRRKVGRLCGAASRPGNLDGRVPPPARQTSAP